MLFLIRHSHFTIPRKIAHLCFTKNLITPAKTFKSAGAGAASPNPNEAMNLYSQMHRQSVPLDTFSLLSAIKSIVSPSNLHIIRHLHAHIIIRGLSTHLHVATSLLHAYVTASFSDARFLFDEMPVKGIITWNTMISGYSNSGDVNKARAVFNTMPARNVGSYNVMISGYVSNKKWVSGLAVFREMMFGLIGYELIKPEEMTLGTVLSACRRTGSIGLLVGKSVHGFIVKNGWEMNLIIGTVSVDMYAKTGLLNYARKIFDTMHEKNVMTWTSLICGCAEHGYSNEALSLFKTMQELGVKPNEMTLTGILKACTNAGLVEEGRGYFKSIESCFGLEPRIQHYGCMVDLLGKAGFVEEAYYEVIQKMKCEPNVVIWGSFLSSCKEFRMFEMAERVIGRVLTVISPENNGGVYTLISDLYVLNGKWSDAERIRDLMSIQRVRKARGSSFIGLEHKY